jgi:hypothetical protein
MPAEMRVEKLPCDIEVVGINGFGGRLVFGGQREA